jgi:UDP-N-acetylmuramyl pentapeptide synthase
MDKADAGRLRLLVKGSRSSAMDKVVAALRGATGEGSHAA